MCYPNHAMNPYHYQNEAFEVITAKDQTELPDPNVEVRAADEVPLFLGVKGKFLTTYKIGTGEFEALSLKGKVESLIQGQKAKPEDVLCYLGPCLTFSHIKGDEDQVRALWEKGYGAVGKRSEATTYLDLPLLVILELRKAGIPMKNIVQSDFDTYENPKLFLSKLRGDKNENRFVGRLL